MNYFVQMTYYCNLFKISITNKSKYNHLKSINHKTLDNSIMRRFIIANPIFDQVDEIMKRNISIFNMKYELFEVRCVSKLSTTLNRVGYNRINRLKLDCHFDFSKSSILSRISQVRYYFSHIYEMRIAFSSFIRDYMKYYYYLK